jgi:hypothetical protein
VREIESECVCVCERERSGGNLAEGRHDETEAEEQLQSIRCSRVREAALSHTHSTPHTHSWGPRGVL